MGILAIGGLKSEWGREVLMIMLVMTTLLVPLGYRYVTADQIALRILVAQHLMCYLLLCAAVPWAVGLVGTGDGGLPMSVRLRQSLISLRAWEWANLKGGPR